MHQTFYVDIDEEISSVIDRLNKSMAKDNYFVVPQRAIFMQSVVNLKLLKREADKAGKNVILVTQDEIGTSMAQRSGISVRFTLEGLEPVSDVHPEDAEEDKSEYEEPVPAKVNKDKQVRLNNIGSSDFYDSSPVIQPKEKKSKPIKSTPKKIPVNKIAYAPRVKSKRDNVSMDSSSRREMPQTGNYNKFQPKNAASRPSAGINYDIFRRKSPESERIDSRREKTLEKMFSFAPKPSGQNRPPAEPSRSLGGRSKKIFFGFILLCLLIPLSVAAYLLVPSAKINIIPNISTNKIDTDIHGSNSAPSEAANIQIRAIDQTQDISLPYDVTGKSAASGNKAHGSVVIYNEYNSSPQPLIATTRLESADGKIFRLTKNVVVPGTTMVSGSSQPGAIEAEVVADQAGSDYNIDPTNFTIPGFSGSQKFDKFYAKSSAAMSGGSSSGDTGGPSAVSQQDIDSAKAKTEAALKDKIGNAISDELQAGEIALPQAEKITITKSSASAKAGDIVSSFNYTAEASVRALIFSENDVKKIIEQSLAGQQQPQDANEDISKIEYANVTADFDNITLDLKVLGEIKITPNIDVALIKKEVSGKNAQQLGDILKKYPEVKNASIEFWPSFVSHVPQYSQRIDIQIDTNSK